MKKLILLILTCMLILGLAVSANAEETGTYGSNITWNYDDNGTLSFYGTGDIRDRLIGSATPWSAYEDDIRKIVIDDGITGIGKVNCKFIETLTICCYYK